MNFASRLAAGASLLAALTLPACAQQRAAPAPVATPLPTAEAPRAVGPALWRVADEDTTIYLFGTVHLLPATIDWKTSEIAAALDRSAVLVTEIDMTPEAMVSMQNIVQSKGMLPAGQTLRDLLDPDQRARYEAALAEIGAPPEAFDPMEPWFATLALANLAMAQSGFDPERGVEVVLEQAVGASKGRGALETIESQIAIFDELPMDAQVQYLLETVEGFDEIGPTLDNLVAEWAEGDIETLAALMNEAFEEDPVLAQRLLYDRNANWAVWIDDRLDAPGTVFVAVGAGHLGGEQSVQDKLADRGIETVRVQ